MLLTRHDLKEMNEAINKIELRENKLQEEIEIHENSLVSISIDKEIELIKYKLKKAIGIE